MAQTHDQHSGLNEHEPDGRDWSKVALGVAALTFVLLVSFFFSINHTLTSMSERVDSLTQNQERMEAMESRMAQIETLPEQARREARAGALAEMDGRLEALAGQVADEQQAQTLHRVRQLLTQARQGMQQ